MPDMEIGKVNEIPVDRAGESAAAEGLLRDRKIDPEKAGDSTTPEIVASTADSGIAEIVGPPDAKLERTPERGDIPEAAGRYSADSAANRDLAKAEDAFRQEAADLGARITELQLVPEPTAVTEELAAAQDQQFHALYVAQQLKELRLGPSGQPAARAATITTAINAYQAEAVSNRGKFAGKYWAKVWAKAEEKMPWLLAALTAKTEIREWSAAGTLGIPPVVYGTFMVTFGVKPEESKTLREPGPQA